MKEPVTYSVGQAVRVRGRRGRFVILDLLLVRGEALVAGRVTRPGHRRGSTRFETVVNTADLLPEGDER